MFMQAEGDLSFPDGKITGLEFYAGLGTIMYFFLSLFPFRRLGASIFADIVVGTYRDSWNPKRFLKKEGVLN